VRAFCRCLAHEGLCDELASWPAQPPSPTGCRSRSGEITLDTTFAPRSRLLRAVRGDKYMVDAYPPGEER
jgi:hypothetical protein